MPNDAAKVIDTASRIAALAEDTLAGLERVIGRWPAEFRVIVWSAVAQAATARAVAARDPVGSAGKP